MTNCAMQMPQYACHKKVWALKISEVIRVAEPQYERPVCRGSKLLRSNCGHCERCKWFDENGDPGFVLVPTDQRFARFCVDAAYVTKHNPQPGGYYVVYEDGYKSFSPAAAFESGYSLI